MKDENFNSAKFIVITILIALLVGAGAGIGAVIYAFKFSPSFLEEINLSLKGQENTEQILIEDNGETKPENIKNQKQEIVLTEEELVKKIVEKVNPSVVSIVVSQYVERYYNIPFQFPGDDFFDFDPFKFNFDLYPGPRIPETWPPEQESPQPEKFQEKIEIGGGTGFVISNDGLILTNKHVVSEENADYTVVTNSGDKYEAKILAVDPFNDLALIKVEGLNLEPLSLGDSDKIAIGETVIAIGNALGEYRNTVTKGVISGIGRTITAGDMQGLSETLENVIQTDAAINFGNSGGPLINLKGEVIGVNTAIASSGQLIGFAIPINQVKKTIESVQKYGKIIYPFLGVRYLLITEDIAKKNNLPVDYGALIVRGEEISELAVTPGSPADKAGLTENDIILEINGQKITKDNSLSSLIRQYKPGDEITLKVLKKGEEKEIKVILAEYS
ncbi:MAG: putative serine protease HtrA [Parcubacteria group bacterium ADurb.Bin159]|nr:MAG: putative serine protease HtrA [Parcubacteria group bacterium ADurb.Bin159]